VNETQKIPWKRISVEAAAIVASILLAFAIDAWWDDSQQDRRLLNNLNSLRAGFSSSLDLLDANLEMVKASQVLVMRFLNMEPEDVASISAVNRHETLIGIWRPRTMSLNNSLLEVMLDAEGLNSLGNPALQEGITHWRDNVAELDELKAALADSQRQILLAIGHYPKFWPYLIESAADAPPISDEMLQQIRRDEYIMALAARKASSIRRHIRTLQYLREDANSVLTIIDSALADRR